LPRKTSAATASPQDAFSMQWSRLLIISLWNDTNYYNKVLNETVACRLKLRITKNFGMQMILTVQVFYFFCLNVIGVRSGFTGVFIPLFTRSAIIIVQTMIMLNMMHEVE
jgi:hypothetical protein